MKVEYGIEEYTYCLSDLEYKTDSKNIFEGVKRKNYERHYNDEDLDM